MQKYSVAQCRKIIELGKQGTPAKAISEQLVIPVPTVYWYLQQAGVSISRARREAIFGPESARTSEIQPGSRCK